MSMRRRLARVLFGRGIEVIGTLATIPACTGAIGDAQTSTSDGAGAQSAATTGAGGSSIATSTASSQSSSSVGALPIVEPGDPGNADVTFTIRVDEDVHAISRLIYGVNGAADFEGAQKGIGLVRMGGNRLTAYNWETNASNAGSDWNYSNDDNLSASTVPGEAVRVPTKNALDHDAAMLVTVPIAGYVAADENGPVDPTASPATSGRFHPIIAKKNGPLSLTPDTGDNAVYADEFVNFVRHAFPAAFNGSSADVLFSLDNEPDLWSSTHPEVHPSKVTYGELTQKNVEFGRAIKLVAPSALVAGFVSYGFAGYESLQDAPDASEHGNFIDYYLDEMKAADQSGGERVVDVLDLHWYSEVYANGQRIIGDDTSPASVEARVQAPRSLWDPNYVEGSWINDYLSGAPIALLPRIQAQIDAHYPGTKLGLSEYNYGASDHISGAIAEAEVLGIFGREGVFLATYWPLSGQSTMVYAAMRAFTSYDGRGGRFGDTSVHAATSDVERASVYASYDASNPHRLVIVAINKSDAVLTAAITFAAYASYGSVDVYTLTPDASDIVAAPPLDVTATNALVYAMPPLSVSVLVPR